MVQWHLNKCASPQKCPCIINGLPCIELCGCNGDEDCQNRLTYDRADVQAEINEQILTMSQICEKDTHCDDYDFVRLINFYKHT